MRYRRVLIAGGAGFIGSTLAVALKAAGLAETVVALDNLKRRGSELAPTRLAASGVEFVHGDIRNPADILDLDPFDAILECSAEPSVHAGYGASPAYVVDTNLGGTMVLLEAARRWQSVFLLLSSSRVYPIAGLKALPLRETAMGLDLATDDAGPGWSWRGISEDFPLDGLRSLYGGTKLAGEVMAAEYGAAYDFPVIVNRCGVVAGPWQMGKVDQGFVTLWIARHLFGGDLAYMGFGGLGLQKRDVLHSDDLADLVVRQLDDVTGAAARIWNVGGGRDGCTVSLAEMTALAERVTGNQVRIGRVAETRTADIAWYVTDSRRVIEATGWRPTRTVETIAEDIARWLVDHRRIVEPILGPA